MSKELDKVINSINDDGGDANLSFARGNKLCMEGQKSKNDKEKLQKNHEALKLFRSAEEDNYVPATQKAKAVKEENSKLREREVFVNPPGGAPAGGIVSLRLMASQTNSKQSSK
jgi:hypothetical protein